MGGGTTRNL